MKKYSSFILFIIIVILNVYCKKEKNESITNESNQPEQINKTAPKKETFNPPSDGWVWVDNLLVRESPDKSSSKVANLKYGTTVKIINISDNELTVDNITEKWVEIETLSGEKGWSFGGFVWEINERNKEKIGNKLIAKSGLKEIDSSGSSTKATIFNKEINFYYTGVKCFSDGFTHSLSLKPTNRNEFVFIDSINYENMKREDKHCDGKYEINEEKLELSFQVCIKKIFEEHIQNSDEFDETKFTQENIADNSSRTYFFSKEINNFIPDIEQYSFSLGTIYYDPSKKMLMNRDDAITFLICDSESPMSPLRSITSSESYHWISF